MSQEANVRCRIDYKRYITLLIHSKGATGLVIGDVTNRYMFKVKMSVWLLLGQTGTTLILYEHM